MGAYRLGVAFALTAFLVMGMVTAPTETPPAAAAAADAPSPQGACTDLLVLTVRGSGESVTESKTNVVRDAVLDGIGSDRTVTSESISYPAAHTDVLGADFQDLIDFGVPLVSEWDYFASVNEGIAALHGRLLDAQAACPSQKWVLIGYSQGSMVISAVTQNFADPSRYAGIVLVADPSRVRGGSPRNLGSAQDGNGLNFWVPGDLGYPSLPAALRPVSTALCDRYDLVCDTTHAFDGLLMPVPGSPWTSVGIPEAISRGLDVHLAYDDAALTRVAEDTIARARDFAIPEKTTATIASCGAAGAISGGLATKPLGASGASARQWSLVPTLLGGDLAGASFLRNTFRKGDHWFEVADDGMVRGVLPAGRWEIDARVTTGLDGGRTVHLVVYVTMGDACGVVSGYVTDADGLPLEGVEVWLETPWPAEGATDRRIAMNRSRADGSFAITGSYRGEYLLFFDDGPAAATPDEWDDEYDDHFDQYYTGRVTTKDAADSFWASRLALGSGPVRVDQTLQRSSGLQMFMFAPNEAGSPVEGIVASTARWRAMTGGDGYLWHAGQLTYHGCMSITDSKRVYVSRAMTYLGWWGENNVRMYRGSSVSGVVRGADGTPAANVRVELRRDPLPNAFPYNFGGGAGCDRELGLTETRAVQTDDKGRYRFSALYGGENYVIEAGAAVPARSAPFSLPNAYRGFDDVTVDLTQDAVPLTAATPTVSGKAQVGRTLAASPGEWTSGSTFRYRWYVGGKAVSGATKRTYAVKAADKGKTVKVKVTGAKAGYEPASKTSKSTAKVAAGVLKVGTPVIKGTPKTGRTLSLSRGTWTSGTTFRYQWYVGGKAVAKATERTYTLRAADKGKTVRVKVTGTKAGYATASRTTTRTAKVR